MEPNDFEELEIYIAYKRLKAHDLGFYLNSISFIADKITEDYFARFGYSADYPESPSLDLSTIHTGNSVKFILIEGWTPSITSDSSNDIIIGTPKPLGVTVLIALAIIYGTSKYLELDNQYLDNQTKKLEIQLKTLELNKVIARKDSTEKAIVKYLDSKIPRAKQMILDTVKSINTNPEITEFKVNGISIKREKKDLQ